MGKAIPLEHLKGIDFPQYYLSLAKNVVRRQRLDLLQDFESLQLFQISENLQSRWDELFKIDQTQPRPLQTFYSRLSRDCLFDALNAMKVNFVNIMHLAVQIELCKPFEGFEQNKNYLYEFSLKDIIYLNHNRAALVFHMKVFEKDGTMILTHDDTMFVNNLSEYDVKQLQRHKQTNKDDAKNYSGLTKIQCRLNREECPHTSVFLPAETGFRYGVVSGDLNPLHTQSWVCKLMGHNQSFVQGLYSTNLALKYLMGSDEGRNLRKIDLRFTRPAYVDQTVHMLAKGGVIEMQSDTGRLLAFGDYEYF